MPEIGICSCGKNIMMYLFISYIPFGCVCVQSIVADRVLKESHSYLNACYLGLCLCSIGCAINRHRLLEKLNEYPEWKDCFASFYCPCCAITQEYLLSLRHEKIDLTTLIWEHKNQVTQKK